MENEWQKTLDDWASKGTLNKESVFGRLDTRIDESLAFSMEERLAIEQVFRSACGADGLLTESAFIDLLQTNLALPGSPEGTKAGRIVYRSLAYLGILPFPAAPGKAVPQPGLSLGQLKRSLLWVLPRRYASIIEEGSESRLRTQADHRRLLFQSLASVGLDEPYDTTYARPLAQHDAFDVDREDDLEFCSLNHDNDGDEIYHDLLDVLYSIQEIKQPGLAGVPRDAFRSVAKQIATKNYLPTLNSVGIPTDEFAVLLGLLLAKQFEHAENVIHMDQFRAAAMSLCAAFEGSSASGVITWPIFNTALRDIAPYIFEPLYDMLSTVFLGKTGPSDFLTGSSPPSSFGAVLTLPLTSQLSTFLIGCAYFGDFKLLHNYKTSHCTTPTAFLHALESVPDEAVVVLSGTAASGEMYTFGVFSPKPTEDGSSIQTNVIQGQAGQERCSIFQLSPVQDIFRGEIGKPGWTVNNDGVSFGHGGGVMMMLKDDLRRAEVRHQIAETRAEDDDGLIYRPNVRRGDWTVHLEISQIEIWSEITS